MFATFRVLRFGFLYRVCVGAVSLGLNVCWDWYNTEFLSFPSSGTCGGYLTMGSFADSWFWCLPTKRVC